MANISNDLDLFDYETEGGIKEIVVVFVYEPYCKSFDGFEWLVHCPRTRTVIANIKIGSQEAKHEEFYVIKPVVRTIYDKLLIGKMKYLIDPDKDILIHKC